jgi:spore coat polysaccharide biosynthesis predicted glycosyltransferase SpsG
LAEIDDGQLVVKALVGVSNPNLAQIQNCVEQSKVHIKLVNSTRDMAALMAWADLAISAAGSTSLELAFMQVPVGSIVIADNQRQAAERMNDDRLAILLGDTRSWHKDQAVKSIARLIESKELREELAARGRNLVDGLGVSRIMSTMTAN